VRSGDGRLALRHTHNGETADRGDDTASVTLQLIVIMRYLDHGAVFYLRIALQKLGGFTEGSPRI
jgi:hypothetical protein